MNKPNSLCIIVKRIELEIMKSKYFKIASNNIPCTVYKIMLNTVSLQVILMHIYPEL